MIDRDSKPLTLAELLASPSPVSANDLAYLAAQEKHMKAAADLIFATHEANSPAARTARLLKDAEALKARLMEEHKDEAANCLETAICCIEDVDAELR